jgi:DNA-binding LacI/PurR family transcriptional regulator
VAPTGEVVQTAAPRRRGAQALGVPSTHASRYHGYLAALERAGLSPHTRRAYASRLQHGEDAGDACREILRGRYPIGDAGRLDLGLRAGDSR